jgi:hypothetical protein
MKKILVAAGIMAVAGSVFAHDAASTSEVKELVPEELTYQDDPAFPKGAQTVVLQGDPKQAGLLASGPRNRPRPHTAARMAIAKRLPQAASSFCLAGASASPAIFSAKA